MIFFISRTFYLENVGNVFYFCILSNRLNIQPDVQRVCQPVVSCKRGIIVAFEVQET